MNQVLPYPLWIGHAGGSAGPVPAQSVAAFKESDTAMAIRMTFFM